MGTNIGSAFCKAYLSVEGSDRARLMVIGFAAGGYCVINTATL